MRSPRSRRADGLLAGAPLMAGISGIFTAWTPDKWIWTALRGLFGLSWQAGGRREE